MINHRYKILMLLLFLPASLISMDISVEPMDTESISTSDNTDIGLLTSDGKCTFIKKKYLETGEYFKDLFESYKDLFVLHFSDKNTVYPLNQTILKCLLLPCLKNVYIINHEQVNPVQKRDAQNRLDYFLQNLKNNPLHILINNANYFAIVPLFKKAIAHWAMRTISPSELDLFSFDESSLTPKNYSFPPDLDRHIGSLLVKHIGLISFLKREHLSRGHIPHIKLLDKRHTHSFNCAKFHPNGTIVAVGSDDKKIYLSDLMGNQLDILTGHQHNVSTLEFNKTGSLLVSGDHSGTIFIWNMQTQQITTTLTGHTQKIKDICFSPDQKLLASSSFDRTIRVWDMQSKKCIHVFQYEKSVWKLHFYDNSTLYSASFDNTVRAWDLKKKTQIKKFIPSWGELSINRAKKLITTDDKSTIILMNLNNGRIIHRLHGHSSSIFSLAFSPDGTLLASASCDKTVKIWNVATGICLRTLHHKNMVNSICFSPDGNLLLSASKDKTARIWNILPKTILANLHNLLNRTTQEQGQLLTLAYNKVSLNKSLELNEHLATIFNQFSPKMRSFLQKYLAIKKLQTRQRKRKRTNTLIPHEPKRRKKLDQ